MKQINLRVEDDIKAAYFRFCKRQRIGTTEALVAIVRAWGQAEMLREAVKKNKLDRGSSLVALGRLVEDTQKVTRLNKQFSETVAVVTAPYNVDIKDLGL